MTVRSVEDAAYRGADAGHYVDPDRSREVAGDHEGERPGRCYGLRVFVGGGGCSGLQYGMTFDNNPSDVDIVFAEHGLRVIVDPRSLPYIAGANIDYEDSLMGGGFHIENPNAVSTCGCGHSFRTKEGAEE